MTDTTLPRAPEANFSLGGPTARPRPRRVAIVIFDDVEVLDFAGPFEVFGVARDEHGEFGFEVFTVALDGRQVLARNGLRVEPHADAAGAGDIDILVVPGGYGSRREMQRPEMLQFIRAATATAGMTLSVCTGALILGAAGLLRRLAATTHYGALDELRALDCAKVLANARVVDNGQVIITTGVSAGIDGALHVVSRVLGEGSAIETANYMQYDWRRGRVRHWKPTGRD